MLTIDFYTFSLKTLEHELALNIIDKKAFLSNNYILHLENNQYCLDIYEGNYRAKELIKCLLDNKLAIIKRLKLGTFIPSQTLFTLQLTSLMTLKLC